MSMALPKDVAQEKLYPAVFAEMLKNTPKPIVATLATLEDLRAIHRIASAAAGGEEELRRKPFFLTYLEPISPLWVDRSVAERLLYCAEHELPFLFAAGANLGSGAPVTPEGAVVQGVAESLAGLVLARLKNPRVRFLFGANNAALDMRSMQVCYGPPEWFKTVAMYADLGKFHNLPTWGTAGCSDSLAVDAQAAWEAGEGILMAVQSEATLNHNVGYLAHGTTYDARMLVLASAMIARARHLMRPADPSGGALACGVIDEVARGGLPYLAHRHTLERFRQSLWIPPKWVNRRKAAREGPPAPPLGELLAEEVRRILVEHQPRPLDPARLARVNELA
jgi:trimethylamine--corrinoid protein Co-methyltransferase